ncbi:MAG: choice-of-anchor Q domain-containing protein [Microcoleaceae cyanobacterium]
MVTITVNTLIDENDGIGVNGISLREAIALAISGDIITFAPSIANGTITLTNGELVIDQSLTIAGDTDNNDTTRNITIDANGSSRVFTVDDGDGSSDQIVILDGLTITGGSTANQFPSQGGGIDNRENLSIRNSTISGNFAADGGGIFNFFQSTATITNSTISGNSANLGGGLYSRSATVNISDSTISGNSAAFFGGGLYNRSATVDISSSTISGNSVNRGGGGIYHNFGLLEITNSTISQNSATNYGGGIQQESGTVNINNSTISGNSGGSSGGGIAKFSGTTRIVSTIIATNTASYSPDVGGFFSNQSDQGNNLIGDATGTISFTTSTLVGDGNNPIDPLLSPLQDNGGATQTQALQPGSPAINAGVDNGLTTDQRGEARIQQGATDIGAFESDFFIPLTPGDDVITLTAADETISALAGNDIVRAKGGNDSISGDEGNDKLLGQNGNDTLNGGADNDTLNGGNGNDSLIGGRGNDRLFAGRDNDILIGVNPNSANPGQGERDLLRGDDGADSFILGNASAIFYDDDGTTNAAGNTSRALIRDFDIGVDQIQLNGSAEDYLLRTTNSGNTNIFYRPAGEVRDLIGIVRGVTGLNIYDTSQFSFV